MTDRATRVVHLAGYTGLVAVLGTADYAGPLGLVVAAVFIVGFVVYAGRVGADALTEHVRREADDTPAVADGGER